MIQNGSGTMAVTITGSGAQTLTGTNTYSGGTTISSGTLLVGQDTSSGTLGSGAVVNNASLVFYRYDTWTFANAISGSGTVDQTEGTVILTGSNTYTGTTSIGGGTLQVGSGALQARSDRATSTAVTAPANSCSIAAIVSRWPTTSPAT
ncbi:MAG: autotransporter-associated beta strand repeat-containing protein [Deltaproteobacteria bacterium]|nr:autotransporter-associated beta strand repeat-containing protein [Deltaproteobacteria bacterium]